jgi:tRNA (guanine-N7-)-methyltransferase
MSDAADADAALHGRDLQSTIKSFVRRKGRMTIAQRDALTHDWTRFGIEWPFAMDEPSRWFAADLPVVLEIGFGNGEALAAAAAADPARNYLGVEVHLPGVGHLLYVLAKNEIDNARIVCADAVAVLRAGIAPASLDEVRLYFPDPWPKTKQKKRRIVQPDFIELVASRLGAGGRFHLATDWEQYARWMRKVIDPSPLFVNSAGPDGYVPRPEGRIETHFEKRGLKLGHGVWDMVYVRTEVAANPEAVSGRDKYQI